MTNSNTPWYRQFWPWFLIALPASVVVASVITIILATQDADTVVVDDYYKAGLAINRDLSREQEAERLDIRATLALATDRRTIHISINADPKVQPAQLALRLTHPTLPDRDQSLMLQRHDGSTYSGQIKPLAAGAWNVLIDAASPAWRIQTRLLVEDGLLDYRLR